MAKSFAWSYSVLTSFETCPRRHFYTKVSKEVSEPQTAALDWGNKVHKGLEHRVKDKTPLVDTLAVYEPIVARLEASAAQGGIIEAEQKMSADMNYNPCGYFAPNVWVRAITDVTVTKPEKRSSFVGDYKTGKPTPASAQLKLCAALTFSHKPYVDKVTTAFIWLANGTVTQETYTRDQIPEIWNEFHPRVQRLEHALSTGMFPPKPSGLCREWCPVPKRLCEHSGKS